ncbi:hypothetical protein EYF80_000596 [Liparis tanakae]|uniref:Uncharacterized protein n=1 Tax=Liparis tanakae TaxID=230148 RepID=A0A4Z2JI58_9TELE|nr:hypothetical protein EYF80_000596 [Liparis tanakae]
MSGRMWSVFFSRKSWGGSRDVFEAGAYLRVAVGEDQLVVDRHRFPLRERLDEQLLFDLRGKPTQVRADSHRQPSPKERTACITFSRSDSVARTSGGPTSKPSSRPVDFLV